MSMLKPELKVTRSEFKTLAIIVLVAITSFLGVDIHLPSMPFIAEFFHTNKAHMQQSVSIYFLGVGASILFYGPLSDKYGRRPIIIFGLVLAVIASIASVFTTTINAFLLTRFFQGVGSGACIGVGRTMIADILQGERYSVIGSYFSTFVSLSPLFAPILGGYIQAWFGWKGNFVALAMFLIAVVTVYAIFCPETNKHKNPSAFSLHDLWSNYSSLLSHRQFMGCTLITGLFMGITASYSTVSSFIFQTEFHIGPILYGWLTTIIMVAIIIGKIANGSLVQRTGMHRTMHLGIQMALCIAIVFIGFSLTGYIGVSSIVIIMLLLCMSRGLVMGNCSALALSIFHEKRGSAGALFGSLQMLITFIISATAGSFMSSGIIVLSITCIFITLASTIVFSVLLKKR